MAPMSKIEELIRVKQMDIERLRREIAALKMVAPLLNDDVAVARAPDSVSGTAFNDIQ
jgi:hypothetical protein